MSYNNLQNLTANTFSANSDTFTTTDTSLLSVQVNYTNATPAAQTFDSGVKEVTSITAPAATAITSGQYFLINSPTTGYYVWFNKDGAGVDPAVAGKTGVAVAILAADTAATVATKLAAALDALADFVAPAPAADVVTNTNAATGAVVDASNVNVGGLSLSVTTQGVTTEIALATDTVTIPAHGFAAGLKGQLTTTGTLPAGLALSTDYFIIKSSTGTVKFASTYANAIAGTAVDITGDGTGVHTFTAASLSATFKLQSSVDGITFFDISGKTVTFTASGSSLFSLPDFAEPQLRAVLTQTSGQINLQTIIYKK